MVQLALAVAYILFIATLFFRIYDSVDMVPLPSPAAVAKKKQAEMVKVKQEKALEIKQEQLTASIPSAANAINQFVEKQRNAASEVHQAYQHFGPSQSSSISMPSSETMREVLARVGFQNQPPMTPYQQIPPQMMPPQLPPHMMPPQMAPQMMPPQMHSLPQRPPQLMSPIQHRQNFIAPPLPSPLPQQQHQQFAPEFFDQAPSPQYSPTPTNQVTIPLSSSLSSQLLGQISQEPKRKKNRQVTGNRESLQRPILPPLTTRKENKDKNKLVVMPPPPAAPLNLDVWDPIGSATTQQPQPLAPLQPPPEIDSFKVSNFQILSIYIYINIKYSSRMLQHSYPGLCPSRGLQEVPVPVDRRTHSLVFQGKFLVSCLF